MRRFILGCAAGFTLAWMGCMADDRAAEPDPGAIGADLGDLSGPDMLAPAGEGASPGPMASKTSALQGDPCTPPTSQLVINELMIHPNAVSDNNGEFIEIHNPGSSTINLQNWTIKDNETDFHKITDSVPVAPGGYVVLCRNSTFVFNGLVNCQYQYMNIILNNTGSDQVILLDPSNNEVDRVEYTGTAPVGYTVELRHPFLSNATLTMPPNPEVSSSWEGSNWSVATVGWGTGASDSGTPGLKNTDVWLEQEFAGCSDSNVCTWDLCEAGACKNPLKPECCASNADCDDGKPCTKDVCDTQAHKCSHAPISGCCTQNSDCVDENPCNSDYCQYNLCRHSSYNTVAGCCWAPPDIDPNTGLPWAPGAKQAYADAQCDDKHACTDDICDLANTRCLWPAKPDCCEDSSWCNDNDICTLDKCVGNKCYFVPKDGCCKTDADCADADSCTVDTCVFNYCRHLFDLSACCTSNSDCPDDGNPCTLEKCINQKCYHPYTTECKQRLPYIEHFEIAGFPDIGWKLKDYGSPAVDHWYLTDVGNLAEDEGGQDKFLKFGWSPTQVLVKSVAYTPQLNGTDSKADFLNWLGVTTVEWRMEYKHSQPSGPVTLRVVATSNGDFVNGAKIYEETVFDDLEYTIRSVELPESLKFSPTLQIGFLVEAPTTFNMDHLSIDDVKVAPGRGNRLVRTLVFECQKGSSCEVYTNPVKVATKDFGIPDVNVGADHWQRLHLCYQDDDTQTQGNYFGQPAVFVAGKPFDTTAPIRVFSAPAGTTWWFQGCRKVNAYVAMQECGVVMDHGFFCVLDIEPQGDAQSIGSHRVGVIAWDEWDPKLNKHNPYESLNAFTLTVLPETGYLVWSPFGPDEPRAVAVRDAIRASGRTANIVTDILVFKDADLASKYQGVFAILGVYGKYHAVSTDEAQKLKKYLDAKGRLYLEGGDFFYTAGANPKQPATVLHPYFKIDGTSDGSAKLTGQVQGANFLASLKFNYSADPLVNSWNDRLRHTPESGSREVLRVGTSNAFATTVTYESASGPYRTIGSSVMFAGLTDLGTGKTCDQTPLPTTCRDLMSRYIYFLENGYPPCAAPIECEDFEVCTTDECTGGKCSNAAITGCVPCKDDCVKEDGTPSCSEDFACILAQGYCGEITPATVKQAANPDQLPKTFGGAPAPNQVSAKATVLTPGVVSDLHVKVKVTHGYRGDVRLTLNHAGQSVVLKKENPADANDNICATYDFFAPMPAGESIDAFNGKPLNGDWSLVALDTDPSMNNGTLQGFKLYAAYTQPVCPGGVAQCDDNNLCTTEQCINDVCVYTNKVCDDGVECTEDTCDPTTGECVFTAGPFCPGGCTEHVQCGEHGVCLNELGFACPKGDTDCACETIEGIPYVATVGIPTPIPDNNPIGVTRVLSISKAEGPGVVRKLRVKVRTTHQAVGNLKFEMCHLGQCVTLHNLSGGNEPGLYHVYDYDTVDGPGTLAVFKKRKIEGDWTLKVSDVVAGNVGQLTNFTVYVTPTECAMASDCDDSNPCTTDSCDFNNATGEGKCLHTTVTCPAIGGICHVNECNPATGECEVKAMKDGSPCEDGKYCTMDDSCKSGVCTPGPARDCSFLTKDCAIGLCNEDEDTCEIKPAADGTACDDGEPCNTGDKCVGGKCTPGSTFVCQCSKPSDCVDDGNKCNGTTWTCNAANKCELTDSPVDCGTAPPCKVKQCIESTGECVEQEAPPFTPCSDGLWCTVGDVCKNGACVPGPARDCHTLDTECKVGACDDDLDQCVAANRPKGTKCELDGLGCTADQCNNGVCEYASTADCSSYADDCNAGVCQNVGYGNYVCTRTPVIDGTVCFDEPDPCTDDLCSAGVCTHTKKVHCTGACGGSHVFDAGDAMCGLEDSCQGGIGGPAQGQCKPTCAGANCVSVKSETLNLPIDEVVGCTTTALVLNATWQYVDEAEVKIRLTHGYLADLTIDVIDPQGYVHNIWNHLGGSNHDFSDTFDFSIPVPYNNTSLKTSGVPMCALRGETAAGTWFLRVCDTGPGNGGLLREWGLYVNGANVNNNPGHRCSDAIVVPSTQGTATIDGDTTCASNAASSTCGGASGPERMYKFTLTEPMRVTLTLDQYDRDMVLYIKDEAGGTCSAATKFCSNQYGKGANPEKIDKVLQTGTYYFGVDTNGSVYDYGPFQVRTRFWPVSPDGKPCADDLDCMSGHCQNGYCCQAGDCCPSTAWAVPPDGSDPMPIKLTQPWIDANTICPASYRGPAVCDSAGNCQGHRNDANCVNFMCKKEDVPDDSACTTAVESDSCGFYKSVFCGSTGTLPPAVQSKPSCATYCNADSACDDNAHCDPVSSPTAPDTPGSNTMTCQADLVNGSASNEHSDCVSNHSQNGYCCGSGDCCPTNDLAGATKCPSSWTVAPVCDISADCEGHRYDPVCSNYQCGKVFVRDDCACRGLISDNCGLFKPVLCPTPPGNLCPATPLGGGSWIAGKPACPVTCSSTGVPGGPEDDTKCDDNAHCDPKAGNPNSPVCIGDVPDGEPCDEGSDCENDQPPTHPGHCQNGFCCWSGDCCNQPTDCPIQSPPSNYWAPPVCDSGATCQGHRMDATCTSSICGTRSVDDDRGCAAGLLSDECGYYTPVYCTGQENQPDPPCPTTCLVASKEDDTLCDPNAHCDPDSGNPSNSICVPDLPNDQPCDEKSDCISDFCQIHFCCDADGCCKGCKVTSAVTNFPSGGTDAVSGSGIRVQTSIGQPSPAGRVEVPGGSKVDFGFMPNATIQKTGP